MNKENLISKFKQHDKDTGSIEVQVVKITEKINQLVEHFKVNKFDHSGKRGLTKLVSRRRKFLDYIKDRNEGLYKKLVDDLGLRK
jgi:small subunit ribosomal protein S15